MVDPSLKSVRGFNAVFQYFVARGFAVERPTFAAAPDYGRSYMHLDDVERRMDSVADLRAAWQWLVISGVGGKEAIAIMGGSYGGFMVLAALVNQPDCGRRGTTSSASPTSSRSWRTRAPTGEASRGRVWEP